MTETVAHPIKKTLTKHSLMRGSRLAGAPVLSSFVFLDTTGITSDPVLCQNSALLK